MKWKTFLLVAAIALAHFAIWVAVFASVFGRVMGSGGSASGLQSAVLGVLGFPLVPGLGEGLGVLALNSLLWGCVLGFVVSRLWDARKRTKVAA